MKLISYHEPSYYILNGRRTVKRIWNIIFHSDILAFIRNNRKLLFMFENLAILFIDLWCYSYYFFLNLVEDNKTIKWKINTNSSFLPEKEIS